MDSSKQVVAGTGSNDPCHMQSKAFQVTLGFLQQERVLQQAQIHSQAYFRKERKKKEASMFAKRGLISGKFPVENKLICNIGGGLYDTLERSCPP